MNVQFDETQEMLRTAAREFLAESSTPKLVREMRKDEHGFSHDLWKAMAELGWQGLALPDRCGGSGMGFLDLCLLVEEMGRACLPSPFISTVAGCGLALADIGGEVADQWASDIASGQAVIVPALDGGPNSEGHHVLPTASSNGTDFVLNGTHLFVPYAGEACQFLCAAAESVQGEVRLFVLPSDTAGLTLTPLKGKADEPSFRLDLVDVHVDGAACVAAGETARAVMAATVLRMDIARCCDIVGALGWVLDDTVTYANERKQFGQTIGSFQSLQHYCADMHVMLDGLRTSAYFAAWQLGEGLDASRSGAIACAYAHRTVPQIVAIAHQIHGAMGVTEEHDLHLYTTRAIPSAHRILPLQDYLDAVIAP
ncbi:MAG: acyl-CoA/acyl-ACP dehydrogenase [Dehalococcoidia bacterium]|nr:acyl-CoA/acyl-ACP dehydrogenase [Dehalococcoidia bacterium]